MSASYWFDGAAVLSRVQAALEDALDEAAERVAADARQRAPIRKVFKEKASFRFRTRELTSTERHIAIRLAQDYYKGIGAPGDATAERKRRRAVSHIRYTARVQLPSRKSMNTMAHSAADRRLGVVKAGRFTSDTGARRIWSRSGTGYEPGEAAKARLTSRGLYEVRSGRAVHTGPGGRVQIGGALKASIGVGTVHETARGVETEVKAAIRYAKYVEFPTVHNRAQPFLLPALKDEQRTFVASVAASIRRSLGR